MKAATNRDTVFAVGGGISIHAAREGGDLRAAAASTATLISIHAAREGGDVYPHEDKTVDNFDFNPRRP